MAVDTFETVGHVLARIQATPEVMVCVTVVFFRQAEGAVMLALDLRQAVTHTAEEAVVGGQHVAVEVEFDHRRGAHQRADQVLVFAGGLDGAGQVAGKDRKTLDPPVRRAHRLQDRTQPRFLAGTAQQTHCAGEVLATGQRVLEAQLEFIGFHVIRDQIVDVSANQVAALVMHFAKEVLVDRLNPPVAVEGQHQHFAFQTFLHLLEAGEFFTKSRQLLLQAFIEHGKAPMDRGRKRYAA
ncbi:hypothetical protein D9M69_525550 [compost metagenome]